VTAEPTPEDRVEARRRMRAASWDPEAENVDLIAQALADGREQALQPFRELFAGGPDTVCRTAYPDGVESVVVPMEDLRAAFTAAGDPS
jgi:hypothetical protein